MDFIKLIMLEGGDTAAEGGGIINLIITFVLPMALMVFVFYFLLIRPEKKRAKNTRSMLDNIQVADEVVTSGGIIGRVLSVKDDTVLIETGGDKTRIRVLKGSITENRTIHE